MAHARHDDAMIPVDVGAVENLNRRSTWGGAGRYATDAAMLDGYSVGFTEFTADKVNVVDNERWFSANFHLALSTNKRFLRRYERSKTGTGSWFQSNNPITRR